MGCHPSRKILQNSLWENVYQEKIERMVFKECCLILIHSVESSAVGMPMAYSTGGPQDNNARDLRSRRFRRD